MAPFQPGYPAGREALSGFYLLLRELRRFEWDRRGPGASRNPTRTRGGAKQGRWWDEGAEGLWQDSLLRTLREVSESNFSPQDGLKAISHEQVLGKTKAN